MSSVYNEVCEVILKKMEDGVLPWQIPWSRSNAPKNFLTNSKYRGINAFILICSKFKSRKWGTFKQISDSGGKIKKGEKGTKIIFWTKVPSKKSSKKLDDEEKTKTILKTYTLFNLEQTEGLENYFEKEGELGGLKFSPILQAENLISNIREEVNILHSGNIAAYAPSIDKIFLPIPESFKSIEDYYSTKFHEIIHWTGSPKRLNRFDFDSGSHEKLNEYSKEELVAEFGSSFLMAEAEIFDESIKNSNASYIHHWLEFVKSDPNALIQSINKAQKACDWILNKEQTYIQ